MELIAAAVAVTFLVTIGLVIAGAWIKSHLTIRLRKYIDDQVWASLMRAIPGIERGIKANVMADIPHHVENLLAKAGKLTDNVGGSPDPAQAEPDPSPAFWNNLTKLSAAKSVLEQGEDTAAELPAELLGMTDVEAWRRIDQRILELETAQQTPDAQ